MNIDGKALSVHLIIAWTFKERELLNIIENLEDGDEMHIHHIDGNIFNNAYWNLQGLSGRRHASLTNKGRKQSESAKNKQSLSRLGKRHTKEWCKKISDAHKGKILSEEHCKNISESHKKLRWWTNGKEVKFCEECPVGWVNGRKLN